MLIQNLEENLELLGLLDRLERQACVRDLPFSYLEGKSLMCKRLRCYLEGKSLIT